MEYTDKNGNKFAIEISDYKWHSNINISAHQVASKVIDGENNEHIITFTISDTLYLKWCPRFENEYKKFVEYLIKIEIKEGNLKNKQSLIIDDIFGKMTFEQALISAEKDLKLSQEKRRISGFQNFKF